MFSLGYFMARAMQNMRGNLLPNLVTICIIAISMLIFSAFSLITFNLSSFLRIWEEKIQIIAYLNEALPSQEVEDLSQRIDEVSGIENVTYVSSAEAMAFMEAKLGSQRNLLEGVQPGVLPPSFEIQLEAGYRNSSGIREVVTQLKEFPQIEEVQYGQKWVDAFSVIVQTIRLTQLILGGLLTAAMTFIIASTLQLTISSRREEIEIMHLVGAKSSFIQIPFYIEGLIQGFFGAVLALALLFLLYRVFIMHVNPSVKEWLLGIPVSFLPLETIGWYLSGGMVLGIFGSFVASIKILKYSG